MMQDKVKIQRGDALLIVDVQNDFLPGGSLAVPHGEEIIPVMNGYIELFEKNNLPVYASRDWHPANHCSFESQGGPWPPHCIQQSHGAEFSKELNLPPQTTVISTATNAEREAYSAFQDTELAVLFSKVGVTRLFIGGLATEYCILYTVKDALAAGFGVYLLTDAVRAINVLPYDGNEALDEMSRLGAKFIELPELSP